MEEYKRKTEIRQATLSTRTKNSLGRHGIKTIDDLVYSSDEDLTRLLTDREYEEVKNYLETLERASFVQRWGEDKPFSNLHETVAPLSIDICSFHGLGPTGIKWLKSHGIKKCDDLRILTSGEIRKYKSWMIPAFEKLSKNLEKPADVLYEEFMEELQPLWKDILRLSEEGLKYKQIGEELGIKTSLACNVCNIMKRRKALYGK